MWEKQVNSRKFWQVRSEERQAHAVGRDSEWGRRGQKASLHIEVVQENPWQAAGVTAVVWKALVMLEEPEGCPECGRGPGRRASMAPGAVGKAGRAWALWHLVGQTRGLGIHFKFKEKSL